ncbi:hypothetical protein J3E69DRAFT_340618 [Trichoderma sp. SZMC 28015]
MLKSLAAYVVASIHLPVLYCIIGHQQAKPSSMASAWPPHGWLSLLCGRVDRGEILIPRDNAFTHICPLEQHVAFVASNGYERCKAAKLAASSRSQSFVAHGQIPVAWRCGLQAASSTETRADDDLAGHNCKWTPR